MFAESVFNQKIVIAAQGATGFVKTATTSGRRQVVDVLTLAYAADPAVRWMYPNSQQYLEYFPNFVRLCGGRAFETGTAHYVDSFAAAALWLPPGARADEESLTALFQTTVEPARKADLFRALEQACRFRPAGPHWYLPLIGVDPVRQGKGFGAALLRHALARCDRDELPAYLESTGPRSVSLYRRHGFEVTGLIQSGSSPTIFPMLRRPRKSGAAE